MRKTLLAAFAGAVIMSAGMLSTGADAMTLAAPSMLRAAAAQTAIVQQAAALCGSNGCIKVQTHRIVHHKPGAVAANHI